jgi:hypothetical protein
MPAYSFQERFIPFLLDGSKDHTVRKERSARSRHVRPGEIIQLYYGVCTKWCRKIGEATCSAVHCLQITQEEILFPIAWEFAPLCAFDRNLFAWRDGFRPEGSTADNPAGAFDLMLRFWKQTHELPFQGVVIYWKDFKAAK